MDFHNHNEEEEEDLDECFNESLIEQQHCHVNRSRNEPYEHHKRCIIHIDIDCFYAQVEMIKDPSLKNVPMGIKQKNLVSDFFMCTIIIVIIILQNVFLYVMIFSSLRVK